MVQYGLKDRDFGHIQATIEPSQLVGGGRAGIFIAINDHYQLANPDTARDASAMVSFVTQQFDNSMRRSEEIIDQIMELAQ